MRKQILLLSVLFTSVLLHAQDATTYRGAFAPAPEPQWTDNWTNWDPNSTVYPAADSFVTTAISVNTTWSTAHTYKISGIIYVDNNATLTILPGTVIRGDETVANSSLFVVRGAKIQALGTACSPIVFTSNKPANTRAKSDWGGIVLLGSAKNNLGTNVQIEGTDVGEPRNFHGGTNDNDNSGTMRYVRIEFGGFVFAPNNEINGLTFGSVGRGTTIDYVQTSFINDDAFEWFGGTVNCKHLVAYRCLDDDFDTDNGFSGTVQYCLGIKDPTISDVVAVSTSEGFESDNDANSSTNLPKTAAKFYNVTQIGAFRCDNNAGNEFVPTAPAFRRGIRIRRSSDLKIYNSLILHNWRGFFTDATVITSGQATVQNSLFAGDYTTVWGTSDYPTVSLYPEDATATTFLSTLGFSNTQIVSGNGCDLLTNVWGGTNTTFPANPDFRPNPVSANYVATTTGATLAPDITPLVAIQSSLFTAAQARDIQLTILETGKGTTSGAITVTIAKPSGWAIIAVPNPDIGGGPVASDNANWTITSTATTLTYVSKPGIRIPIGSSRLLGLRATRNGGTSAGTNQSLNVSISGGGDNTSGNNSAVQGLSAN